MKTTQTRKAAIEEIVRTLVANLDDKAKQQILEEYWPIGPDEEPISADDEEVWSLLSSTARMAILTHRTKEPSSYIRRCVFELSARVSLETYKNSYLEHLLNEGFSDQQYFVIGRDLELEFACPCCQFKSFSTAGDWDICPVCLWEWEPHYMSGSISANHAKLEEYREDAVVVRRVEAEERNPRFFK